MVTKLQQMVELSKCLKLGQPVPYKGLAAKVMAFNDEGVFLTVEEIKVAPEEFEGPVEAKMVKDKQVEEARREAHQLRNEIDRLLNDPEYYAYRREREGRYRREMMRMREDSMYAMRNMMSPIHTGIYGGGEFVSASPMPKREMWIDPLSYKQPSQKK